MGRIVPYHYAFNNATMSMSMVNNLSIPNIPNVSLVAFYGKKTTQLIALIENLQRYLENHKIIQRKFTPYQLEQVHGTIIGIEGLKTKSGVINKWFYEVRQETRYIDFPSLINYFQHRASFPMTIRFGGYDSSVDYNFLSRNQHLYFRSFQLHQSANQTIPVLIAWSWKNNSVSLGIDNLRQTLQQFNLMHKYHPTPDAIYNAIDNDFYLRLGTIDALLTSEEIQAIATEIRNVLATQPALYIPIELDDLAFAQYQDLSLTPETTKVIPVSEITASGLEQLYPD